MPERIVDAHVHFWNHRRFPLRWWTPDLGLRAEYAPEDLDDSGAEAVIAVQAGGDAAEAAWLSGLAVSATDPRVTVVAQFEVDAMPLSRARVDAVRGLVRGVRISARHLPDAWAPHVPGLDETVSALAEHSMVLELLVRPGQLPDARALAIRHPELAVVLCHLAAGAPSDDREWAAEFRRLSPVESVAAKFSGVVGVRSAGDAAEIARVALAEWGAERLMFGSDWPMSTRVGPWSEIVDRTRSATASALPASAAGAFWAESAERVYGSRTGLAA